MSYYDFEHEMRCARRLRERELITKSELLTKRLEIVLMHGRAAKLFQMFSKPSVFDRLVIWAHNRIVCPLSERWHQVLSVAYLRKPSAAELEVAARVDRELGISIPLGNEYW